MYEPYVLVTIHYIMSQDTWHVFILNYCHTLYPTRECVRLRGEWQQAADRVLSNV